MSSEEIKEKILIEVDNGIKECQSQINEREDDPIKLGLQNYMNALLHMQQFINNL